MIAIPVKTYTPEEYLELEIESTTRNEYRDGEIIPMTGGTPTHNEIIGALTVILRLALKGKSLQVFVTDQRLWIPDRKIHTYPDVMVVPRPILLQEGRKDTVTQPIFIAEVLSNSTKNYDRGEKFADYRTISSFQEYLLVEQSKPHVEQYVKQGANKWLLQEFDRLEDRLTLSSIGIEVSLAELYEGVEF
ncbi:Uma2 family endonuclease [Tumidithrix elongata RA019]|uniref:Uma2 family endonuclease n=1 Tax=Tumidithrix elongata BACA0141 TaxID=2716417 RepID=A0AAW9PZM7_9CYAN|nr:Uma2 family endonuclease [Tumidithrix elongata RA019]